jgi:hypothetical protein
MNRAGTALGGRQRTTRDCDRSDVTEQVSTPVAGSRIDTIAGCFDTDGRKNVDFGVDEYRAYALRVRRDPIAASLACTLASEFPEKGDDGIYAGPLVMMFGQGHQNFLERLIEVSRGTGTAMDGSEKLTEALFRPWTRTDETAAFRWDPEEDQRYALRFGNPSKAGAAPTVHGANRLATIGMLSFPCFPVRRTARPQAPGTSFDRDANEVSFVWPVWTFPSTLAAIERLLSHPDLIPRTDERPNGARLAALAQLGVVSVYRARRIANGKYMNITRATPI